MIIYKAERSGFPGYIVDKEVSLSKALDIILTTDLAWGGEILECEPNQIVSTSRALDSVDKSTFTGDGYDMVDLYNMIRSLDVGQSAEAACEGNVFSSETAVRVASARLNSMGHSVQASLIRSLVSMGEIPEEVAPDYMNVRIGDLIIAWEMSRQFPGVGEEVYKLAL